MVGNTRNEEISAKIETANKSLDKKEAALIIRLLLEILYMVIISHSGFFFNKKIPFLLSRDLRGHIGKAGGRTCLLPTLYPYFLSAMPNSFHWTEGIWIFTSFLPRLNRLFSLIISILRASVLLFRSAFSFSCWTLRFSAILRCSSSSLARV